MTRGQLKVGLGILEKVRSEVAGTKYEQDLDGEILFTYLNAGLTEELGRANAGYIAKYPKSYRTPFYRAIQMAYRGRLETSRAMMDSLLTAQRTGEGYKHSLRARLGTESTSLLYEGLIADLVGTPASRVQAWQEDVSFIGDKIPFHDQWYHLRRLAQALSDAGHPIEALEVLQSMLQVNPNLIYCLILAVECNVALEQPEAARKIQDQLKWSLSRADEELPAKKRASELEALVIELEGSS